MVNINRSIFRAYDIRGVVDETLNKDVVYLIGRAIATEVREKNHNHIVVGRDGRLSGPVLIKALIKGLMDGGCHVIDIGQVPSPVLYFAVATLDVESGVMLTGSHNPPNYNGVKTIVAGQTLTEKRIQALYQRIIERNFSEGHGTITQQSIMDDYIQAIVSRTDIKRKLKIVIDCGNGVSGDVAPKLFSNLNCEVISLFTDVDGRFPNHQPDPSVPENLQTLIETVKKENADIGFAFDGDADRCGVVTEKGEIIWPDRQLMLFAADVLSRHKGSEIIFDVKSTRHLNNVIEKHGGKPLMWKTGHSLLKEKMRERKSLLAGEMSGHIFFKENWFGFDDGMYTATQFMSILSKSDKSISEIFSELPDSVNTPEIKMPIAEDEKFTFIEELVKRAKFDNAKVTTIDGLRVDFEDGWGLVRASNTTPCLTLRFEGDNEAALERIKEQFYTLIRETGKLYDMDPG